MVTWQSTCGWFHKALRSPIFLPSKLSQCSASRDDPPPQQRPSCQNATEASRNLKRSSPAASPPAVLLSGFRSRCHIVIKGAFPASRVQQGLTQLIHLYSRAGFPKEELQTMSDQLLIQHQSFPSQCQTRAFCLHDHVLCCFPVLFWFFFLFSFLGCAFCSLFLWCCFSLCSFW